MIGRPWIPGCSLDAVATVAADISPYRADRDDPKPNRDTGHDVAGLRAEGRQPIPEDLEGPTPGGPTCFAPKTCRH